MTSVEQLELLYKQFDNLTQEIDEFLEQEEFDMVLEKVRQKDKLIKQMAMAKKTANLTIEETKRFDERNREISKKNFELVDKLQQMKQELAQERKETKNKIKLRNAYSVQQVEKTSNYFDSEE